MWFNLIILGAAFMICVFKIILKIKQLPRLKKVSNQHEFKRSDEISRVVRVAPLIQKNTIGKEKITNVCVCRNYRCCIHFWSGVLDLHVLRTPMFTMDEKAHPSIVGKTNRSSYLRGNGCDHFVLSALALVLLAIAEQIPTPSQGPGGKSCSLVFRFAVSSSP